ncbi:methylenetetrahydrofolate reductase [NAD(P)H] [Burkholderia gladioli]|uniref:methylenetetrahydrofolate reductase [NAD(P)H] n=1 Tax=Burkholderia gladioli TaxID=28095 RepID=UPI000649F713|nr:methylenetetrahydrofolate reductase [NAD(P)H] [Burkholderia gladioli]MDA0575452.1 methylenetetrahydrofolate reductase [NAD(P)H] [Burkholderia gladioli]MDA0603686.1 methylenetetrahydrofolate reductase [NAD(P)H] [Burkholderia gladioli]
MKPIELSLEFFPPKTAEGADKLRAARAQLLPLKPKFVSVTFGAGGSTQQGTLDTVLDMQKDGLSAAPHLSCIGSSKDNLRAILDQYRSHGIRQIVALRGDLPSGMGEVGELRYACDLVRFIRAEHGDWFHLEVAAYPEYHPQSRSPKQDLQHFADKVKAGANSAITQYFFNADAYFRFVDDAARLGVEVPIVPGIMPITNYSQLMRFSEMCGAEVPRWIARRLESFGDDRESIRAFGADVITAMCDRLIKQGVPGLHFYTLNLATPTRVVCERLGLSG